MPTGRGPSAACRMPHGHSKTATFVVGLILRHSRPGVRTLTRQRRHQGRPVQPPRPPGQALQPGLQPYRHGFSLRCHRPFRRPLLAPFGLNGYVRLGRHYKQRALTNRKPSQRRIAGVVIFKATLGVHLHPAGAARQFATDANRSNALLGWLGDQQRAYRLRTGVPYHCRLERRRCVAGLFWAKSVRYRRGDLPKPPAHTPKPMRSMPLCWPAWAHFCLSRFDRLPAKLSTTKGELHIGRSP
jgi:hypothetical protein